jgi:hypothetical protein
MRRLAQRRNALRDLVGGASGAGTRRGTVDHAKELWMTEFTIPGVSEKDGNKVADLQPRTSST